MKIFFISGNSIEEGEVVGSLLKEVEGGHKSLLHYQIRDREANIIERISDLVFNSKEEANKKLNLLQAEKVVEDKKKELESAERSIEILKRFLSKEGIKFEFSLPKSEKNK